MESSPTGGSLEFGLDCLVIMGVGAGRALTQNLALGDVADEHGVAAQCHFLCDLAGEHGLGVFRHIH